MNFVPIFASNMLAQFQWIISCKIWIQWTWNSSISFSFFLRFQEMWFQHGSKTLSLHHKSIITTDQIKRPQPPVATTRHFQWLMFVLHHFQPFSAKLSLFYLQPFFLTEPIFLNLHLLHVSETGLTSCEFLFLCIWYMCVCVYIKLGEPPVTKVGKQYLVYSCLPKPAPWSLSFHKYYYCCGQSRVIVQKIHQMDTENVMTNNKIILSVLISFYI